MSEIKSKYVCIKADGCDLCICPESSAEGSNVVLGKDSDKHWYFEPSSSTVRCADTDKCFTASDDGKVTLTTYGLDKNQDQAMVFNEKEGKIEAKKLKGKQLSCTTKAEGACVCLQASCADNTWHFEHVKAETKLFYLKTESGLVLGTEEARREPGTRLVLVPKKDGGRPYEQLWYEAEDFTLRCAHNHLVIDCSQEDVTLEHYEEKSEQNWRFYEPTVYLESTRQYLTAVCLTEGSPVRCADKNDSENQRWYKENCL